MIEHSIGPVWEANHVWLIFIFVVTWTAFPTAYASIMLTLFVPLTIAALGIVLRGASFAFRKAVVTLRNRRIFGGLFAALLGAGAVLHGRGRRRHRLRPGSRGWRGGDPVDSWLNPTSIVVGILAVALAAYLAAVYLVWDARRDGEHDLAEYFRRRAVVTGVVAAVVGGGRAGRPARRGSYVFDGMTSRALPAGDPRRRLRRRRAGPARPRRQPAAPGCSPSSPWPAVIAGWGVAQWPYLLPESLTVSGAAAPSGTLTALARRRRARRW